MRKGRPKYPQPRDVVPVKRALEHYIPLDAPLEFGMRESLSHVPNFRLQGMTDDIQWTVDIYRSGFYHVQLRGESESFKAIPPLISYLYKRLKK